MTPQAMKVHARPANRARMARKGSVLKKIATARDTWSALANDFRTLLGADHRKQPVSAP